MKCHRLLSYFGVSALMVAPFAVAQQGHDDTAGAASIKTGDETASQTSPAVQGYSAAQAALQKRTKVPLRLPTFIPPYGDADNLVFATVESADAQGYDVEIAFAEDCHGANVCHLGEIQGSTKLFPREGRRVPVALHKGLTGYFIDSTCGASCNDSEILWREGDYHYSIGMKAEEEATLVKIVNSAIDSGPGGSQ